jgi:sugar transferase (PEP-CTERM/EpsH1 system associated)
MAAEPPLVAHLIYQLKTGGLEKNLIRLVRHTPPSRFRHVIICLSEAFELADQLPDPPRQVIALGERGFRLSGYRRLTALLRKLRPRLVHTRNLGCLEGQVCAALAGVPARVHGEHGRDVLDPYGASRKYNALRRLLRPLTHQFTVVSRDLGAWLEQSIGVPAERVTVIRNGVDTARFVPRGGAWRPWSGAPPGFDGGNSFAVGTVGRMAAIKNQVLLVRAFLRALEQAPELRPRLRLVLVGEGPLREPCRRLLEQANAAELAWLPGEREDIPELMRSLDLFALPSTAEGLSNTILEAMASGLPVAATRVGGNSELVDHGHTGLLTPPGDEQALAEAILAYARDPQMAARHGAAGRQRAEAEFEQRQMLDGYLDVYESVLARVVGDKA